ncbi:MAG: type 4a pilus biogenesis protein PilO [Acidimicrobiales bacterium]
MTRRNMLIAGVAAGLILVLWYLLLWSPRKADLAEAKDRREKAEVLRDELAIRVTRLRASQKDEPMKRAQVEALRTTIPDDPNLAAFILDTNDAASKAGIDFISIAPSEPTAGAGVAGAAAVNTSTAAGGAPAAGALPAEVKLQLQITGGYFQVLDFLNRIGEMPRLVITDGLNVSSDEKAKLSVGVTARMFVRAVPAAFGGVPVAPAAPVAPPAATSVTTTPAASTPPPTATAAPAVPANTSGARS